MAFHFTKWHGLGNDFILVNGFQENLDATQYGKIAQKICDRHFGIGADGLILLLPSERADLRMRIFNNDASEAEMCGNGIRCLAVLAYEEGLVHQEKFTVQTGAGILTPQLLFENGKPVGACVDMGAPILEGEHIPVTGFGKERAVNTPIHVADKEFQMTCVSMGNPHVVIFVDDVENFPVTQYGPQLETSPRFPRKTNVEFVTVRNDGSLRMRVWERGAGVTLACGTGACATLVAAALTGRSKREANVHVDGGTLHIRWGEDNHIYMKGAAQRVFSGTFEL